MYFREADIFKDTYQNMKDSELIGQNLMVDCSSCDCVKFSRQEELCEIYYNHYDTFPFLHRDAEISYS